MNDLDVVREMRADAPEPGRERLAAGRERLQRAMIPGHRRSRRPVMVISAGAAMAAGVVAVVAVRSTAGTAAPPSPAARPPAVRLLSAEQVLGHAAAAAQRRPGVLPGPRQWVYEKGVKRSPAGPITMERWTRFDGQQSADIEHGRLVILPYGPAQDGVSGATPQGAAAYLRSLPTGPAALLAAIYRKDDAARRDKWYPGRNAMAFSTLMTLMYNAPVGVPSSVQADVYRAVAEIPGVRVGRLLDALGHPAIALSIAPMNGSYLMGPRNYALVGLDGGSGVVTREVATVVSHAGQR